MVLHYQITVKEYLEDSWSSWFDGLTISHAADGTTMLAGLGGALAFASLAWFIRRAVALVQRNRNRASAQTTQPQIGGA